MLAPDLVVAARRRAVAARRPVELGAEALDVVAVAGRQLVVVRRGEHLRGELAQLATSSAMRTAGFGEGGSDLCSLLIVDTVTPLIIQSRVALKD